MWVLAPYGSGNIAKRYSAMVRVAMRVAGVTRKVRACKKIMENNVMIVHTLILL